MKNLCFIGAGRHAAANIFPAALAAGARVAGVATRHMESAHRATQRFGGNPYDNWQAMLETEPCDGVVVVAQPAQQLAVAMACTGLGKPVFVEKPLGWTAAEAAQAARAAREADAPMMVGFMKRHAPAYREVRRLIEAGELGAPRSFEVFFGVDSAAFCPTTEDFLKLAAIHMVDLLRMLLGEEAEVRGFETKAGGGINLSLSLRLENGAVGTLCATGMDAWSREREQVGITFDRGFVQVEDMRRLTVHRSGAAGPLGEADTVYSVGNSPASGTLGDLHLRGFTGEMAHFLACLEGTAAPDPSAEDNVKTMELCEAILRAVAN